MHQCPEGFEYTMDDFNKTTKRIWITNHTMEFQYREGAGPPKSIWGFYKPKSKKYYAPINSKKMGKEVRLHHKLMTMWYGTVRLVRLMRGGYILLMNSILLLRQELRINLTANTLK